MKTKRIPIFALSVCAMLFAAPVAQAFYNPSTGRWLSRDPIAEKGGLNLYAFVHNQPITLVDRLGKQPCDECGEDVTGAVSKTLSDISYYYHNRADQQLSACKWIIGLGPYGFGGARGAWSIKELAYAGFPGMKKHSGLNLGECRGQTTITFENECHFAGAANYAMWGVIMRLCQTSAKYNPEDFENIPAESWSLARAQFLVMGWMATNDGFPPWHEVTKDKLAFTAYGYNWISPGWAAPQGCGAPNSYSSKRSFDWWWDPMVPAPF